MRILAISGWKKSGKDTLANHLVDNHGASRRDRLLHHGATGFADEKMVRHQQSGHLVRPAIDMDTVAVVVKPLG